MSLEELTQKANKDGVKVTVDMNIIDKENKVVTFTSSYGLVTYTINKVKGIVDRQYSNFMVKKVAMMKESSYTKPVLVY